MSAVSVVWPFKPDHTPMKNGYYQSSNIELENLPDIKCFIRIHSENTVINAGHVRVFFHLNIGPNANVKKIKANLKFTIVSTKYSKEIEHVFVGCNDKAGFEQFCTFQQFADSFVNQEFTLKVSGTFSVSNGLAAAKRTKTGNLGSLLLKADDKDFTFCVDEQQIRVS